MENTLSAKRPVHGKAKVKPGDLFAKILFIACACISIIAVFGIIGYILYGSIPAFRHIGFFEFLFGTSWNPTHDRFGILPMLVNSLIVTVGAALIGGTVGVFTAIFLAFWCPDKFHIRYRGRSRFVGKLVAGINKIHLRTIFDQIINVLAGIPSIVYGLFGLEVLVKLLSNFGGDGKGILACSILLAIMILPTVTSLSKNALDAVPAHYYEGALALGNTKAQAVFKVVVPAARSGIISALILGIGRAVGEAMAIVWVSGNRVLFPTGLFSYVRTLTTNIVMEMAYADTAVHRPALIATGLVLLVIVLLITLSLNLVPKEFKGKRGNKVLNGNAEAKPVFRKRGALSAVGAFVGIICAVLVGVTLAALVIYILVQGIGYMSHDFFFGEEGFFGEQSINVPTLWPALLGTLELIGITLVIALPVGICAAIYLNEYAKKGSVFVKIVRTFIDALAGVPSIVFGLFGFILFVPLFGRYCVLAGAFTMVLVVLPTVIRSTEEALFAVPMPLREASYGLGASKVRTIFKIVLPSAFPGIATAAILSIGRILGESAALLFTMGTPFNFSGDPARGASSLSVLLYTCGSEAMHMPQAYVLAVILLLLTIVLNLIVYFIERHVKKKR